MRAVGKCKLAAVILLAGCAKAPDYAPYRQAIKGELLDPNSAEFKDEAIRVLWSKEGARLKVYCAMVNGDNAFGGKSGYKPAIVVISAKQATPDEITAEVYKPGKAFVNSSKSLSYYLQCIRGDTERHEDDMYASFVLTGPWDDDKSPAIANSAQPVISTNKAPETD